MAALTKARNTRQQVPPPGVFPSVVAFPIADNVKIYPGSLVMLDGGYLKPAATASGKLVVGRASSGAPGSGITVYDNTVTGHAAAAFTVPVDIGVFYWANKSDDLVVAADVGSACWASDDQTVCHTSTGASCAGRVLAVDTGGVWVLTYPGMALT